MTGTIFSEWLQRIDKKFKHERRSILLFLDNFSGHSIPSNLTNIKIKFYPPNCTSILQPMDQGIIANFKHFYRRSIAFSVVEMLDSDITDPLNINIKDAIDRTVKAWKSVKVKASALTNCFKKAGHEVNEQLIVEEEEAPIIDPLIWRRAAGSIPFAEYVAVDNELTTCETLSDDIIIANANAATEVIEEEESEEEPESEEAVIPTIKAVRKGTANFRLYLQAHSKDTNDLQELLNTPIFLPIAKFSQQLIIILVNLYVL